MSKCLLTLLKNVVHFPWEYMRVKCIYKKSDQSQSKLIQWYPLCTAGLSSAHEVLTADTLQIYCNDTADGHGLI